jgi:hypothetical protein
VKTFIVSIESSGHAGTAIALRPETIIAANRASAMRHVINDEANATTSGARAAEIAAMPDTVSVAAALRASILGV